MPVPDTKNGLFKIKAGNRAFIATNATTIPVFPVSPRAVELKARTAEGLRLFFPAELIGIIERARKATLGAAERSVWSL